jgi:hypothetical protein
MPIRRSPASRSLAGLRAARTRATMSDTLRQATRNNPATTLSAAWQTSHAQVSSHAVANRDPGRAQGTAATTAPCSGQLTRRVVACRNTRCRAQIQHPATAAAWHCCHSPHTAARTESIGRPPPPWAAPGQPAPHRHAAGLQVHPLDHRVLDPQHTPPYPRRAHAVPIMIVSDCGRPETLDEARRAPLSIMNRYPQERQ